MGKKPPKPEDQQNFDYSKKLRDSSVDIKRILATSSGIIFFFLIIFGVLVVFTGVTNVKPGEVALIVNNLTGTATPKITNGTIIHLPLGLTRVYKLDRTQVPISMTGRDAVQIKTNDGSNVTMDVEVQYQIIPEEVAKIISLIGRGDRYKSGFVRAYARSIIRDGLGKLSVTEIADPANRDGKLDEAKQEMNKELQQMSITVTLITATNPSFNADYERMIKERKEADQEVRNQKSAQETARQIQERKIAEYERIKSVEIRKTEGELAAKVIAAKQRAVQMVEAAKGKAFAVNREGERILMESQNEAEAIKAEGIEKAEGIREMARAYAQGGQALVREALAEKFRGVTLNGRPYSHSSHVERLQIEEAAAAYKNKNK